MNPSDATVSGSTYGRIPDKVPFLGKFESDATYLHTTALDIQCDYTGKVLKDRFSRLWRRPDYAVEYLEKG